MDLVSTFQGPSRGTGSHSRTKTSGAYGGGLGTERANKQVDKYTVSPNHKALADVKRGIR